MSKEQEKQEESFKGLFNTEQLEILKGKSSMGVTWSTATIKTALKLRFGCGTTGYNLLLSQGYPLPTIRTLQKRTAKISFEPGIAEDIFFLLKTKVATMDELDKECVILMDEMNLQSELNYDPTLQSLIGTATIPASASSKSSKAPLTHPLATHGFTIMLAGVKTRWKQVVAYHFTGPSFCAKTVCDLLLDIIKEASKVNLHVNSLTNDMGPGNIAC